MTAATRDPLAPRLRWFGWGPPETPSVELPDAAEPLLARLGVPDVHTPPVALEDVRLPASRLDPAPLAAVVGADHVRDDRLTRVTHAAGRSYLDLLALRAGDAGSAPDAVVYPADAGEVAAVLAVCAERGIDVVPFGGGTSVVGGVTPPADRERPVVALDLARLDRLLSVDPVSLTATAEAGILGPELERRLGEHGLTLGHHPQSFEFSTLGGWVATRSAGQASTGYGAIADAVVALRCATPAGELVTRDVPATAAGPDLRELLIGSEGALGVITAVTLRVRPVPAERRYEAWTFPSFADGVGALRALEQAGVAPDVTRLSDEAEVALNRVVAAHTAAVEGDGVAAILGWEGDPERVAARHETAAAIARDHGGRPVPGDGGDQWAASRYAAPYLRDVLLDRGVLVETLETAAPWSRLAEVHTAVAGALDRALRAAGTPPLVLCHVSHVYPTGASLYFTVLAAQVRGGEADQWRAAKGAALDAMLAHGATITHHHAVGRDHAPWLSGEIGPLGVASLQALKQRLDPAGVMNPGVLGLR
ncbi:MAG TPA: FAD-binding oxidoreductase [Capillimicrobium sp.]|nr:FAD-binding oxidoreductase [Capillimicrobium sp.]